MRIHQTVDAPRTERSVPGVAFGAQLVGWRARTGRRCSSSFGMSSLETRLFFAPVVALWVFAACEGDDEGATGGFGGHASSVSSGTADGSTSTVPGGMPLPPECDFSQSFATPGCADALRAACLAYSSEAECDGAPPALFSSYVVACSWSKVVRFADPSTCTVDSVSWRCEAGHKEAFITYYDPCDVSYTDIFTHWSAVTANRELIKSRYGTPIAPEQPGYYSACGASFDPPRPQPICSCTEVACSAP